MIIGIDGRYAEDNLAGIGNYIKNLAEGLIDNGFKVVVFYSKKPKLKIKDVKKVLIKAPNHYFFEQFYLPLALRKEKVDIYHATGNLGVPMFTVIPTILTIHDLIPLTVQGYFKFSRVPFLSKNLYRFNTVLSCNKAKKIITVSKFVKKEVTNKLNISETKIEVIYSGVKSAKAGKLPKQLMHTDYILNHGGIDTRKNIEGLLMSFVLIKKKLPGYKLVITGKNSKMQTKLKLLVKKLNLGRSVIFAGYVSNETLSSLINNARCICYPTFAEGFGLPIIEGFAAGTPVVCSNITSLPEIAGNAASFVDPKNYKQISTEVISVLKSKKKSHTMIKRGKKLVSKFNWKKSVSKTISIYKEVSS